MKEFLHQTLLSIEKASGDLTTEIFIVDNASLDGTVDFIQKTFPAVRCIANKENVGFGKANNQALKQAQGQYILYLNPDTIIQEDTLIRMKKYMDEHPSVGLAGCKVMNSDGTLQLACRRSFPTPLVALPKLFGLSRLFPENRFFGKYNLTYLDPDESYPVDAVSGSFMFTRASLMNELGGFDEAFFMYGEDLDLCFRVKKSGYEVHYVADTSILHYKGESAKFAPFDSIVAFYSAMNIFVKKHFSSGSGLVMALFLHLGIILHLTLRTLLKLLYLIRIPLADALGIYLAFGIALAIRFNEWMWFWGYQKVIFFYAMIYLLAGLFLGMYQRKRFDFIQSFLAVIAGAFINGSLTFFIPRIAHSRLVFAYSFLFLILLLPGWRLIHRIIRGHHRSHGESDFDYVKRTIIVGAGSEGERIVKILSNKPELGYLFMGFADNGGHPRTIATWDTLPEVIRIRRINTVIFTSDRLEGRTVMSILYTLRELNIDVKIVPENLNLIYGKTKIERFEDISVVDMDYALTRWLPRAVKRLADVLFSLFIGILLFPVAFPLKIVRRYKVKLLPSDSLSFKIWYKGNERPVCWWYPLVWAVFSGKMSFVGDVITLPEGSDRYYLPGITGLIQLENSDHLSAEEHQRFMLYYLRNYSLLLDMEISMRTIFGI